MPNIRTTAKTNNKPGSKKDVELKTLTFDELWEAYPSDIKHINTETKKDIYNDHCAIKVSDSLYTCGVLLKSFKGTRCWYCPAGKDKHIHAIRAQELNDYLETKPFANCPDAIKLTGGNFRNEIKNKTGIIFFKDYWLRSGESEPTGDHIDLWKNGQLASENAVSSFFRVNFPDAIEATTDAIPGIERATSLLKSKEVSFWEIK